MKRLLLLRHGKAEGAASDDHERALIARGETDSARMGRFLRDNAYVPDIILCSTALRTRQTLDRLLPELGAEPECEFRDELYLAEPDAIIALIRRMPGGDGTAMIVGHNPGLEQCALALACVPFECKSRKHHSAMDEKFPTCALAVIDFDVAKWSAITPGRGEIDAFVRPKDLEG